MATYSRAAEVMRAAVLDFGHVSPPKARCAPATKGGVCRAPGNRHDPWYLPDGEDDCEAEPQSPTEYEVVER